MSRINIIIWRYRRCRTRSSLPSSFSWLVLRPISFTAAAGRNVSSFGSSTPPPSRPPPPPPPPQNSGGDMKKKKKKKQEVTMPRVTNNNHSHSAQLDIDDKVRIIRRRWKRRQGQQAMGPPLSEQQKEVLEAVRAGRSVFITGAGGTGKTFLLRLIIHALKRVHPAGTVFVTASTGVVASALAGQTLHSFAGIGLGTGEPDALLSLVEKNEGAANRWRRASALVIDEISMIDGELFDKLDSIARGMRPLQARSRWGGIQLVVSGDFFQLPPIKAPNPDKEFAFEADCWDSCFDIQVELAHVFRQSEFDLVQLLEAIRRGHSLDLSLLDRCCVAADALDSSSRTRLTQLFPRKEDVRRVNSEILRGIGKEIVTFRAADWGMDPWKNQLTQGIAEDELNLCEGARVLLIENRNSTAGLVNGAAGVVVGFVEKRNVIKLCSRGLLPLVRFDCGAELLVEPAEWEVMEGEEVMAWRRQIPLILAWALSVHKCQGMTIDCIYADLSRAFGCGMVYVALSRVRSLDGIHLSGLSPSKIKAHPKAVQFYHRFLC